METPQKRELHAQAVLSGQLIAHYRVARHLGSGGMGEVFLAEDTKLDRSVALKLLPMLLELPRQGLNYYVSIGAVQHALGDDEAALDSMEKAVEEHSAGLNALNWGLFWSDLRSHPRAQAILRKMNLVK
jgi:serine/threonine protein kinase